MCSEAGYARFCALSSSCLEAKAMPLAVILVNIKPVKVSGIIHIRKPTISPSILQSCIML